MRHPFRTTISAPRLGFTLGYHTPTLLLGSCFAESIGGKLRARKLPAMVNPFGAIYNPVSVGLALDRIISGEPLRPSHLNQHNGLWFSFLHHSSFSHPDREQCLDRINRGIAQAHAFWQRTQILALTWGTARAYYLNSTGSPVANCHKLPSSHFQHRLLGIDAIVSDWQPRLERLIARHPGLNVILTVSPVRHWKDGATGNLISKSTLVMAIHRLIELFPGHTHYFPAYELLMDDLRDYRFYAPDMLHPSQVAVDYIWEQFCEGLMTESDRHVAHQVEGVLAALAHRPSWPTTELHQEFVEQTLRRMAQIEAANPSITFQDERALLAARLRPNDAMGGDCPRG